MFIVKRRSFAIFSLAAVGVLVSRLSMAAPVTYEQDNFIGAPGSVVQMVYSPQYQILVMRNSGDRLQVMNVDAGSVTTYVATGQFTDMSLSPDGRFVFVADFGGANRVVRLDLQDGTYESRITSATAYRIEATGSDNFILASQDQWISFWYCGWGAGTSIDILSSSANGYYASVYYGDIEYDRNAGRLIHGNSNLSSREIAAFRLVGSNFSRAESSGGYGSADAYGGSSVLATDGSVFYYGRLQVLSSDVRQNQRVFPSNILAATGNDAFAGGGAYYDAVSGSSLGSLGYPMSAFALNRGGDDFWAYDSSVAYLRHFVAAGSQSTAAKANADFASVAQGYPASLDVAANDNGFSGQLTVAVVTPPVHGTAKVTGSPGEKAGIRVQYTAEPGYSGADSFVYSITGGDSSDSANVGLEVLPAKALNDSYVVLRGSYNNLRILDNDVGFGSLLTVSIVTPPNQNGYAYVSGSPGSRSSVSISYNASSGQTAPYTETLAYRVTDGTHTDSAVVSARVVDFAAIDDVLVTGADTPATLNVLANDLGFGFPRTVGIYTNPLHGSVALRQSDNALTYTPAPGYLGQDVIAYSVDDGTHIDTATINVSVIVDADGDKVDDTLDNCLGTANADQRDTDGDGYGNWCDADLNNDLRVNFADLAMFRGRFATSDPDADLDGNGNANFADLARLKALFGKPPGPSGQVQ